MSARTLPGAPVFIGGDGRSGTTLLAVVLNAHPQLAVGPELHFNGPDDLGPYLVECLDLLIADDPRAFGKELKENPQFKRGVQFAKRCHRWGVGFAELRELVLEQVRATGTPLKEFPDRCRLIHAIGERKQAESSAQAWGIKIMREVGRPARYSAVWPEARFVHVVRDGRDVAASQMGGRGTWGYEQVETAAQGWVSLIRDVRTAMAKQAPLVEVRYEDLVREPEATTRRLAADLGLEWDSALLQHTQASHDLFANPYNHPSAESAKQPINDAAVGRYTHDLTPEQIASFEQIAGGVLEELGYDRSG